MLAGLRAALEEPAAGVSEASSCLRGIQRHAAFDVESMGEPVARIRAAGDVAVGRARRGKRVAAAEVLDARVGGRSGAVVSGSVADES